MRHFTIILLFWLLVSNAFATPEKAVSLFIESQHEESDTGMVSDTKHGELINFITLKSDSDKVVVHWLYTVANFWQHRLTLLHINGEKFDVLSSIGIKGQVNSVKLDNTTLLVELLAYGKNDPRCCPSEKTTNKYEIKNGKMLPIN